MVDSSKLFITFAPHFGAVRINGPAVKRESGENPGQTTLLCFPQPSCSTITTIVTVKQMMGRRCCNGISQKTCHDALEI